MTLDTYESLHLLLTTRQGRIGRAVTFHHTRDWEATESGLVFDWLVDSCLRSEAVTCCLSIHEVARTLHMAPNQVVFALADLCQIRLESNHIKEHLLRIREGDLTPTGELVCRIELGGWLTYQLFGER